MKNKSSVAFVLGLVGLLAGMVYAAPGVRGSKGIVVTYNSTSPVIVSKSPAVVYSVILGTGAVTDFVVLIDSANATAATQSQAQTGYKGRIYASSATQNTQVTFDPPLQFNNGITAINATTGMTSGITWETGRALAGQ